MYMGACNKNIDNLLAWLVCAHDYTILIRIFVERWMFRFAKETRNVSGTRQNNTKKKTGISVKTLYTINNWRKEKTKDEQNQYYCLVLYINQ